jgi:DNA (cytosine-5)-methyltransferase 1
VSAGGIAHAVAVATLVQSGYGEAPGQAPRALDIGKPLGTVVAGGSKHGLVTALLSLFYSNDRGRAPDRPAPVVTAEGQHHSIVTAHLEQANGGPRNGNLAGRAVDVPVSTVTATGSQQRLVQTVLVDADALPPDQLAGAVRVAAFLIKYYGNEDGGHGLNAPLGTVTTLDRFAVVTVTIDAKTYIIVDIGMRMLTPRELARAQGFPDSYILDPIGPNGKPLSKSAQIRMIGNSVCPDVAEALVRANMAEMADMREAA